jgi:hypothetical protein
MLTLSPMSVAPVCRVEAPLQLTCKAFARNIQWNFMIVDEQGKNEDITMFSTASALSDQPMPITVNSTTFTLIRNSSQNVLPLIATLFIDSVGAGLNGTVVNCLDPGNSMSAASTAIQIIDTSNGE